MVSIAVINLRNINEIWNSRIRFRRTLETREKSKRNKFRGQVYTTLVVSFSLSFDF